MGTASGSCMRLKRWRGSRPELHAAAATLKLCPLLLDHLKAHAPCKRMHHAGGARRRPGPASQREGLWRGAERLLPAITARSALPCGLSLRGWAPAALVRPTGRHLDFLGELERLSRASERHRWMLEATIKIGALRWRWRMMHCSLGEGTHARGGGMGLLGSL